ncbi:helix-turn-helix domain-containing protein [Nitratireductor sp. ZSWI3]|uniref:helix-turn-helix domain-containing protein n=1 Tax=Nitratireductor sp. ZSWI3 TaxID=2966359 RepID=UPI00214F94E9|nr:helix-turn-helix domain-containing protein [Nitratireductor sp. ZSWI3]MCR4269332.1 helix-turn-helix domain-containing protein [Nitratireductor sp. ZSWI3]
MAYASEDIIEALKKGRGAKGLSQRALSARTGVPQSHISKIESGNADIRLSSLIELARALDLEVRLVPRKALPAVDSVVRSITPAVPATERYRSAVKELQRSLDAVDKLRLSFPDLNALNKIQENLRTIGNFKTIDNYLDSIKRVTQPLSALQKIADNQRRIDEAVRMPAQRLKEIEEAANRAQALRNLLVHAAPSSEPRRAYRLDDDDDDDHHQEVGDD